MTHLRQTPQRHSCRQSHLLDPQKYHLTICSSPPRSRLTESESGTLPPLPYRCFRLSYSSRQAQTSGLSVLFCSLSACGGYASQFQQLHGFGLVQGLLSSMANLEPSRLGSVMSHIRGKTWAELSFALAASKMFCYSWQLGS
jgi:hypothetical protein